MPALKTSYKSTAINGAFTRKRRQREERIGWELKGKRKYCRGVAEKVGEQSTLCNATGEKMEHGKNKGCCSRC